MLSSYVIGTSADEATCHGSKSGRAFAVAMLRAAYEAVIAKRQ
jgi:hypothetical protein